MKKSFSLIELVIVIVVVGILYSTVNFSLANTSLNQAANQIISHINYTRHLSIKDNKMQYYPISSDVVEMNRSKYWFKQWWQIRFSKTNNGEYFYEIFSDFPRNSSSNFDGTGKLIGEFAKNPLNNKYLDGNYPGDINDADERLNLTKYYSIKIIKYNDTTVSKTNVIKFLFDNYGNVYLSEGEEGDKGDINPYNKDKRIPLLSIAKLTLCHDDNCEKNISICISPKIGNAYLCK